MFTWLPACIFICSSVLLHSRRRFFPMNALAVEEPYVAVVHEEYLSSTCSKCFKWNAGAVKNVSLNRCGECKMIYYCGRDCQIKDWPDHKEECGFLQKGSAAAPSEVRMASRMIIKSRTQPTWTAFNGRTYKDLVHHVDEKMELDSTKNWLGIRALQVRTFMGSYVESKDDVKEILEAISKKTVNSFSIYDGMFKVRGSGIYLGCRPDCFAVCDGQKMMLKTTKKNVKYNKQLTISYCEHLATKSTEIRREYLEKNYFFSCQCEECLDLELEGKRMSGNSGCCQDGWFAVDKPFCNICGEGVSEEQLENLKKANALLQNEWSYREKWCKNGEDVHLVDGWMRMLDAYKSTLSHNNVNLLSTMEMIMATFRNQASMFCVGVDICHTFYQQMPLNTHRCLVMVQRFSHYYHSQRSFREKRQACEEALNDLKAVYGEKHYTTKHLKVALASMKKLKSANNPMKLDF